MPAGYVHNAPVHLNGNLFAAVDVETTGLIAGKHSMIEICILPLNGDYSINKSIIPFTTQMKPIEGRVIDPEAMRVNKIEITHLMLNCLDADKVLDLLVNWYEKISLGDSKRIIPIAQNWPFDRGFLIDWMGIETFWSIFSREYRDTMEYAANQNDRCDMLNMPIPFPKLNLSYLANKFHIENPDQHRALGDAATTAMVYKALLMHNI